MTAFNLPLGCTLSDVSPRETEETCECGQPLEGLMAQLEGICDACWLEQQTEKSKTFLNLALAEPCCSQSSLAPSKVQVSAVNYALNPKAPSVRLANGPTQSQQPAGRDL